MDTARPGEVRDLPSGAHIHLIAICGVAMAALAGMLKRRGFRVTGSDENVYPPMSTVLERLGIEIQTGYGAANLRDRPDLVVVGNTVKRTNPEVVAMIEAGLPFASLPQVVGDVFLAGKRSLVVAGTHGKSTSTALLGWVLECAGRDPSVLVGGDVLDFGGNFKLGEGEHFVIEGDEYDTAYFDKGPKFLHYRPQAVLLTAIEFDHADIYRDLEHVKSSFRKLVELLRPEVPLVVAADFPHALEVARRSGHGFESFGVESDAQWTAAEIRDDGSETHFTVRYDGRDESAMAIRAPGAINVRNALGVYALCRRIGLTTAEIDPGLRSFRGVARRQELVGEFGGVTLIDDFAHHPTAVAGTIAAMRGRYRSRRLWAAFEPRSNTSRRKVFQSEYVSALAGADEVVIGGVMRKATDPLAEDDMFAPEQLVADLHGRGVHARSIAEAREIADIVAGEVREGDVVLLMSNGGFGGLRGLLVDRLARRVGAQ